MSFKSKMRRLGQHPLLQVLSNNKGNPRTLVLIEPLWGIPYNLIAPFATLYMYTQGVTDVQIGLILSITMVVQVFFSFFRRHPGGQAGAEIHHHAGGLLRLGAGLPGVVRVQQLLAVFGCGPAQLL